jgi:hypothetical protein
MIDLIIGLAIFFLVPVIVLPCLVILAMFIRGITPINQKHPSTGMGNRRGRNLSEIAVINTSLISSSLEDPCITSREREIVNESLTHQLIYR